MNAYNIFSKDAPGCILFHAIAEDELQVETLANENEININDLTIEIERHDIKDEIGRNYKPTINDALVY